VTTGAPVTKARQSNPEAAMTSHLARLYALAGAILVFLVTWASVAAHPWQQTPRAEVADPRITALDVREKQLRAKSARVQRIVDRRWADYRRALAKRKKEIAAANARNSAVLAAPSAASPAGAPSVRVVTVPPLTTTKTS
jgi:hypothetical protein